MAKHEDGTRIDPDGPESGGQYLAKIEASREDDQYTNPVWDSEKPGFAEEDSSKRLPLDKLLR